MDPESTTGPRPAGILRRLASLGYDALILAALLFVATLAWLPFTGGEAITPQAQGWAAYAYRGFLFLVAFAYYGLSWTRGGQTLGMRAWRIRLTRAAGGAPGWPDALVRFTLGVAMALMAGFGLWYLRAGGGWHADAAALLLLMPAILNLAWAGFDREGRSLQDLASLTRLRR
ncbi:MAG: RDD family protein [Gammaproteobacteria bacterium]